MIRLARKLHVGVLAGGDSPERAVSLASGRCVARALAASGCTISCVDPWPGEPQWPATNGDSDACDSAFEAAAWDAIDWRRFDACFLALHGGAGEDGRLQRYLEGQGVAFTGPRADAAHAAMSKAASKRRFRACGVPTPDWRSFDGNSSPDEIAAHAAAIGLPLVVKPDSQGSSLGVGLATRADELATEVEQALRFDAVGLLEVFVAGREFTVAVLDRQPLPLVEICSRAPIFSYAEKYDAGAPHFRFDTGLPQRDERTIVDAAVAAVDALDAEGLVRVDVRLDDAGQPWVLELNATPGMTDTSLAPAAAQRAGLDLPGLCQILLEHCLQRRNRR
jgi:D-alanine-D-alanine ligase